MAFDTERFKTSNYSRRTFDMPVPDLKDFFDEDETPIWKLQGITALEFAEVNDAIANNRDKLEIVQQVLSAISAEDKVQAILEASGVSSEDVPNDYVRRIELLQRGSVEPKCDHTLAKKLADVHGVTFYALTRKIDELSGMGQQLGESNASGQTSQSE